MRGGSLTRFRPDGQSGNGFFGDAIKDVALSSARGGWKGLKTGVVTGLPINFRGGIRGAKRGGKRAIKRKALEGLNRVAKKKLNDIFGT